MPGGRPSRASQCSSTSASVSTSWRSPSSATSASAIARWPAGSVSRIASSAGRPVSSATSSDQSAPVRAPSSACAGRRSRSRRRARRASPMPRRGRVAVQEEVDVDLRARRVVRAHREVAPVLLRACPAGSASRSAAARAPRRRRPAERDDLARLLDAESANARRGSVKRAIAGVTSLDRARPSRRRCAAGTAARHRGTLTPRATGTTSGVPVSGSSMTRQRQAEDLLDQLGGDDLGRRRPARRSRPSRIAIRWVA